MARIDQFLANVVRMKALGMQLTSGGSVTLRFPDGDKPVSNKTSHEDLLSLISQIAPAMAHSLLVAGQPASFPYESQERVWLVRVQPGRSVWQATFLDDTAGKESELV